MLATIQSCAIAGLDGILGDVVVDVSRGQTGTIAAVRLPVATVRENIGRVPADGHYNYLFKLLPAKDTTAVCEEVFSLLYT